MTTSPHVRHMTRNLSSTVSTGMSSASRTTISCAVLCSLVASAAIVGAASTSTESGVVSDLFWIRLTTLSVLMSSTSWG